MFTSCHLLLDHVQFTLIHGPNILGSYAILFFTASDFTFITRHIFNWGFLLCHFSFLPWPSCLILSGAISNCSLFFPSNILDTFRPVGLIFCCHIFCLFILSIGLSRQEYWSGLPFPSPGDLPDPGIEPRSPALQADALQSDTNSNTCSMPMLNMFHRPI